MINFDVGDFSESRSEISGVSFECSDVKEI